MVLILLEALGALLLLVLIVWWTMFSGRKNGELPEDPAMPDSAAEAAKKKPADAEAQGSRPSSPPK